MVNYSAADFAPNAFRRTELALGTPGLKALANAKVAVFGIGGVGSWCVESLVRTGVGNILIVDPDRIAPSNINRQAMATSRNVGELKTKAFEERLLEINPFLNLTIRSEAYTAENASSFNLSQYDCVVDAIDSLADKANLIRHVTALPTTELFSSMGAAFRVDPLAVRKTEFWKVQGDALARQLRSIFRKSGDMPKRKFTCVYSSEMPTSNAAALQEGELRGYGSLCHVTAVFGLALAGLVVDSILKQKLS